MSEELNQIIDGVLDDENATAEDNDPNMLQIDDIERLSMMTMFIWTVRQSMTTEQRQELIGMILLSVKRHLIKKLGEANLSEKQVKQYREQLVVQINNNIQVVEARLRRLFVDGIPGTD